MLSVKSYAPLKLLQWICLWKAMPPWLLLQLWLSFDYRSLSVNDMLWVPSWLSFGLSFGRLAPAPAFTIVWLSFAIGKWHAVVPSWLSFGLSFGHLAPGLTIVWTIVWLSFGRLASVPALAGRMKSLGGIAAPFLAKHEALARTLSKDFMQIHSNSTVQGESPDFTQN